MHLLYSILWKVLMTLSLKRFHIPKCQLQLDIKKIFSSLVVMDTSDRREVMFFKSHKIPLKCFHNWVQQVVFDFHSNISNLFTHIISLLYYDVIVLDGYEKGKPVQHIQFKHCTARNGEFQPVYFQCIVRLLFKILQKYSRCIFQK